MESNQPKSVVEVPKGSALGQLAIPVVRLQHWLVDVFGRSRQRTAASEDLRSILEHCRERTDISDHLVTLYSAALSVTPKLMVELGVRTGESTNVLARVARTCGSRLVSADIDDCSRVCNLPGWLFVQTDDIEFAKRFPQWGRERGLPGEIDFLFIDTSHIYEHTVAEIRHWFPYVREGGKVAFHDTNQRRIYFRRDGSVGIGWDNARGVIAALEEYLKTSFSERHDFTEHVGGWLIEHEASCSGFTVLTKLAKGGRA
jgi:cephalosporin hydroxylase